jgi:TRAP-type mannitol/chloroaromatic compound transport system permease large subunit
MGVAPKGTTLWQVAMAAAPYIGCALFVLVLLIIFPGLALYLPSLMTN